jgi:hypothetical protein
MEIKNHEHEQAIIALNTAREELERATRVHDQAWELATSPDGTEEQKLIAQLSLPKVTEAYYLAKLNVFNREDQLQEIEKSK